MEGWAKIQGSTKHDMRGMQVLEKGKGKQGNKTQYTRKFMPEGKKRRCIVAFLCHPG